MALSQASSASIVEELYDARNALTELTIHLQVVSEAIARDNGENETINDMLGTVNLLSSALSLEHSRWNSYNRARMKGY